MEILLLLLVFLTAAWFLAGKKKWTFIILVMFLVCLGIKLS